MTMNKVAAFTEDDMATPLSFNSPRKPAMKRVSYMVGSSPSKGSSGCSDANHKRQSFVQRAQSWFPNPTSSSSTAKYSASTAATIDVDQDHSQSSNSNNSSSNYNNSNRKNSTMNTKKNAAALCVIEAKLREEEKLEKDLELLIQHAQNILKARVESNSEMGSILSMKQLLHYEASLESCQQRIDALEDALIEVNLHGTPIDYQSIMKPTVTKLSQQEQQQDQQQKSSNKAHGFVSLYNKEILEQARQRVQSMNMSLSSRAA